MIEQPARSLGRDRRAVTPIIAFILLFGIAVVAFSGYQATTVPDQNAETEFQHSQDVRDDMVGLYSGALQAGEGERQFRSIQLGTQYQERLLAFNPPPPTGTIETTSPASIQLNPIGGMLNTRSLVYSPNYNELPASSTVYDTSTLFTNPQDTGGNPIIHEEQALIDDDEVRLIALQNEFGRSGSERASVNFNPARGEPLNVNEALAEQERFSIEIPTRLDEEYWNDSIDGAFEEADAWAVDERTTPNTLTLEFDQTRTLYVNTVGVGQRPAEDPESLFSATIASTDVSNIDIFEDEQPQTQEYNFTIGDETLAVNETVSINLTEPVTESSIDYPSAEDADVSLVDPAQGSVEYVREDDTEIRFTANETLSAGDTVTIQLGDIEAGSEEADNTYNVSFRDPQGGIIQDDFVTFDSDAPPEPQLSDLDIAGQGSEATISEGEDRDIAVTLTNLGGDGDIDLELTIDAEEFDPVTQTITTDAGDESEVLFEEVTGELDSGDYSVTVTASVEGEEITQADGDLAVITPDPQFTELAAEVTEYQSGQDVIQDVDVTGEADFFDGDRTVEIEISGDNPTEIDDPIQTVTVSEGEGFGPLEFDVGGGSDGQSEVDVTARLKEDDVVLQECVSTQPLVGEDDDISLAAGDFNCEFPS